MKGTRAEIVRLLGERGEATVAELTAALGIAAAALRRHLEILGAEGTVEYRSVRQATGRPYFAYRLTEAAREAAAKGYPRLLERLVLELGALGAADTAGTDGHDLLDTVFARMSAHMAADYADRVQGETLAERVASLAQALRDEGIVERWEEREDGFHLQTTVCPHRRAARATPALCASEREAIALLLGAEVEQTARLVDGASCCDFVARGSSPAAGQLIPLPVS